MEKLDNVIRALEECYYGKCTKCPYEFSGDMSCHDNMNRDALEVIRALVDDLRGAQDEIHRLMRGRSEESMCGTCEFNLEMIRKYHVACWPEKCPRRRDGECPEENGSTRSTHGDMISRRALIEEVNRFCGAWFHGYQDAIADVLAEIGDAPAVEAEPVVHAHWKRFKHPSGTHGICCSHCETRNDRRAKRCPECGAHMDEEVSE